VKQGIHPESREVVSRDREAGVDFLTHSTVVTHQTCEVDGHRDHFLGVVLSARVTDRRIESGRIVWTRSPQTRLICGCR